MTEQEWLVSGDPDAMLDHVNRGSWPDLNRKLRLLAVAFCRLTAALPGETAAIEVAERYADGLASSYDMATVGERERGGTWTVCHNDAQSMIRHLVRSTRHSPHRPTFISLLRDIVGNPFAKPIKFVRTSGWKITETVSHVYLDRDILTPAALSLAQAAYEHRDHATGHLDPVRLAITADALEEAGCDSEPLLRHLRGWRRCKACTREGGRNARICVCKPTGGWLPNEAPHVRGCWAIDLILGKE